MKWIKLFEDFKKNNEEGTLITQDDIIKCIKKGGLVFSTIVHDLPDNDPEKGMKPALFHLFCVSVYLNLRHVLLK